MFKRTKSGLIRIDHFQNPSAESWNGRQGRELSYVFQSLVILHLSRSRSYKPMAKIYPSKFNLNSAVAEVSRLPQARFK